ncbi:arginine biosynthesis protein ArgJ [Fomitiporia mediterranea MF3/22]|uniref:arginine biosynthesis protein ArgJ n=1 Tax=Fomitiporia mediterranea (strain MF3/22) TaxID=694068 RepID=UPI0004407F96|nr:arginine biosynthesis protein ArgJ [Fomitiporia mediterranea MF3/22]EJD07577.1 arginine biosynthesis protein ArgJ [Fomitiporia mediterranea MF3/22]
MALPRSWIKLRSFARMSSTKASANEGLTFHMAPLPPKTHHHRQIPSSAFPRGYLLGGTHAGVKKKAGILDLGLAISSTAQPAAAAGVFTRNAVAAAPVLVCQDVLQNTEGRIRGVVVNSGCANAVTGKKGMEDAWSMVKAADTVANALIDKSVGKGVQEGEKAESLVMSTGVIGQPLPIDKILSGISSFKPSSTNAPDPNAESSPMGHTFTHWERAAHAFMTTDTFPKLRAASFSVGGREYRIGGMTKGAGMIHPNMGLPPSGGKKELHATLLGLILTDAPVTPQALSEAVAYATDRSFNSISVDGDMSTNDTLLVLANGAAVPANELKNATIDVNSGDAFVQFRDALTNFAAELAQLVVRDGEGATKFVTVTVDGAATYADAHAIASRISTSALVKTALYGEDANWGRILAATGSIPPSSLTKPVNPSLVSVFLLPSPLSSNSTPLRLLEKGEPVGVDEVRAKEILRNEDIEIRVELGLGGEKATYWTCDFSYEYVRINGDYRS